MWAGLRDRQAIAGALGTDEHSCWTEHRGTDGGVQTQRALDVTLRPGDLLEVLRRRITLLRFRKIHGEVHQTQGRPPGALLKRVCGRPALWLPLLLLESAPPALPPVDTEPVTVGCPWA